MPAARLGRPDRAAGGVPGRLEPFIFLFSESAGRALVGVPVGHEKAFTALCDERGVAWTALGLVGSVGAPLEVAGQFQIPLDELRAAWSATLPSLFG